MVLNREEREKKERERQVVAIRKYNKMRRSVYDARLDKFLNLYPYAVCNEEYYMKKFVNRVNSANIDELNGLIESFNEENNYWNTYYVLQNCNKSIHDHIVFVLTMMHAALARKLEELENDEDTTKDTEHSAINTWGKQGEKEVDYVLKWLPNEYVSIQKDCSSKYGDECILLENQNFIDESQEYDHIVVGPQGIFMIETKNYSGKLSIDNEGNWLRMKKGDSEWIPETNPIQQVNRHHLLLESIVGFDVQIIDIVCLSHPDIIVTGQNNSRVTVVKKDLLGDYIMKYPGNVYSEDEIENLVYEIGRYKISK